MTVLVIHGCDCDAAREALLYSFQRDGSRLALVTRRMRLERWSSGGGSGDGNTSGEGIELAEGRSSTEKA